MTSFHCTLTFNLLSYSLISPACHFFLLPLDLYLLTLVFFTLLLYCYFFIVVVFWFRFPPVHSTLLLFIIAGLRPNAGLNPEAETNLQQDYSGWVSSKLSVTSLVVRQNKNFRLLVSILKWISISNFSPAFFQQNSFLKDFVLTGWISPLS